MTVPHDLYGYAIDEQTGEVHRRYADHAKGLRRTTNLGVYAVLGDKAPVICPECWPPEKKRAAPKRTREYSFVEHQPADELNAVAQDNAEWLAATVADTDGGS